MGLQEKVAAITGAAKGIGLAIAERFVAEGAYSGAIRPPVPMASGHPFRFDPAGDSGLSGHPQIHLV